jgi:7-cyano-7-deazaguanine reductase
MNPVNTNTNGNDLPLGKLSAYPSRYDPSLLFPIARHEGRARIGIGPDLPFIGSDLWRCYEVSWLNNSGLPHTAILKIKVPCTSASIVESKSLKLYLNSLNDERFDSAQTLCAQIQDDLSRTIDAAVHCDLVLSRSFLSESIDETNCGICIDEQDIEIRQYEPNPHLLRCLDSRNTVSEYLYSRLLKSNCPVTNQPDWGCVHIEYRGTPIDHAALLRYVVSYRHHQGFHEQCVEQIFCDIMQQCQPLQLSVYARYTRRGGIDINPWRATAGMSEPSLARSAQQ